jgi:acetyltransferase-like isoleucine patch superfamily enzyme
MNRRLRLAGLAAVALLPPGWKPWVYGKLFGYRIDPTARIGVTILDAAAVDIGAFATVGHGNLVLRVGHLSIGARARIGVLNVLRGGDEISIGRYVDILRRNELTSIVDPDLGPDPVTVPDPRLTIGDGSVVTDGHRLDFTDRVELGRRVILGGRASSLWTHNRERTAPIRIGDQTYVGSECRMAPGSAVPARSLVALGSVISGELEEEASLIGGVPARHLRALSADERALVGRRTRDDLPDGI